MKPRLETVVWLMLPVVGCVCGCREAATPPPRPEVVRTMAVEPLSATQSGSVPSYIAVVKADRETELSFKVGGVLDRMGSSPTDEWQEGDPFEAGDLLAQLREGEFRTALDSAKADAMLKESVFDRGKRLRAENAISQQEWDTYEANYLAALAALRRAETNLADSRLMAPFKGRVLSRLARLGETVGPGQPVLRVGDLRSVVVELGVPDKVVRDFQIYKGREIRLQLPALRNTTHTGLVEEVGVAAREDARLFRVVIRVQNPEEQIKPGMTATVALPPSGAHGEGAVLVRLSALVSDRAEGSSRQLYVFVVGGDQVARRRLVRTGEILRSSIVVEEGLKPGERVVIQGTGLLHDGAPVTEAPEPRGGD